MIYTLCRALLPDVHAKFQNHRPSGSGEDFQRFLISIAMAAILVMWPGPFLQIFVPVSEQNTFEHCGRQLRSMDAISSPYEPNGSGELKRCRFPVICANVQIGWHCVTFNKNKTSKIISFIYEFQSHFHQDDILTNCVFMNIWNALGNNQKTIA